KFTSTDFAYYMAVWGRFLPVDRLGDTNREWLATQNPPVISPTLRELVAYGLDALPYFLEHLDDRRPTQVTFKRTNAATTMFHGTGYEPRKRVLAPETASPFPERFVNEHTLTVGD